MTFAGNFFNLYLAKNKANLMLLVTLLLYIYTYYVIGLNGRKPVYGILLGLTYEYGLMRYNIKYLLFKK
jgi:hypothetical protein